MSALPKWTEGLLPVDMDGGGWKTSRLFLETYVHASNGGRSIAEKMDLENGPIGMNLTGSQKQKRYRFGKTG